MIERLQGHKADCICLKCKEIRELKSKIEKIPL